MLSTKNFWANIYSTANGSMANMAATLTMLAPMIWVSPICAKLMTVGSTEKPLKNNPL